MIRRDADGRATSRNPARSNEPGSPVHANASGIFPDRLTTG